MHQDTARNGAHQAPSELPSLFDARVHGCVLRHLFPGSPVWIDCARRVRSLVQSNDCLGALTVGNLKNRDLDGELLSARKCFFLLFPTPVCAGEGARGEGGGAGGRLLFPNNANYSSNS